MERDVRRPVARGQDVHIELHFLLQLALNLCAVFKPRHDIPAYVDVLEHPLQLVGELAPALSLELGDGVLLSVHARALAQEQPLRQILLVERLEHILP